jgi:hypothetical protein
MTFLILHSSTGQPTAFNVKNGITKLQNHLLKSKRKSNIVKAKYAQHGKSPAFSHSLCNHFKRLTLESLLLLEINSFWVDDGNVRWVEIDHRLHGSVLPIYDGQLVRLLDNGAEI